MSVSTAPGVAIENVWRRPRLLRRRAETGRHLEGNAAVLDGAPLMAALHPLLQNNGSLVMHLVGIDCDAVAVARAVAQAAKRHDECRVLLIDATMLADRARPDAGAGPGLLATFRNGPGATNAAGGFDDRVPLCARGAAVPKLGDLRALYDVLRRQFALILVECPPVTASPDTAILSSLADQTILVARAEHSRIETLAAADILLKQAGARPGAVLIGERRRIPRMLRRLM